MRRDLFGHLPLTPFQHDAAEGVQAWRLCRANVRLSAGTPAPVISRACAPHGAHRRTVHPQRWPATGDGQGDMRGLGV